MGENAEEKIKCFDAYATNDSIRKFKLLLPHLPVTLQSRFALIIKLMEVSDLERRLQSGNARPPFPEVTPLQTDFTKGNPETIDFLDELLLFSTPKEKQQLNQIKNTLQSIAQMQDAMEMLQMLRELFPDAFSGNGDPMEMFSALQGMNLF
ncbi:MAG: hypothetical protein ACI4FY_09425 [Acetatifactor sp.]